MAKGKRKKRKEEAEKPDPFLALGLKALEYARNNVATVVFGGLVVVGGVSLALYWPQLEKQRELDASRGLYEADKILEAASPMAGLSFAFSEPSAEDLEKAVGIYEKVAQEHSGTAASRRALLSLGDAYMKLAEQSNRQEAADYQQKAADAYQRAVARVSPEERYYALNGLGSAREAQEDFAGAADAYRQIVDDTEVAYRDTAALDLARVLALGGRSGEARAVLESFEQDYPSSSLKETAKVRLLLMSNDGLVSEEAADAATDDGESSELSAAATGDEAADPPADRDVAEDAE